MVQKGVVSWLLMGPIIFVVIASTAGMINLMFQRKKEQRKNLLTIKK